MIATPSVAGSRHTQASPTSPPSATAVKASRSAASSIAIAIAIQPSASSQNSKMPKAWLPDTTNEATTSSPPSSSSAHDYGLPLMSLRPNQHDIYTWAPHIHQMGPAVPLCVRLHALDDWFRLYIKSRDSREAGRLPRAASRPRALRAHLRLFDLR